ncbi:MAG: hypothetical protein MPJ50_11300 [Pirellulales bacterium]|nr:hypothetical protein [Pirellulales bacterium]
MRKVSGDNSGELARFEVNVPKETLPGYYPIRVVNGDGVSSPQFVCVDGLQNLLAGREDALQLPFAVTGRIAGDAIAETQFAGEANNRITVEVEARRLGSALRPVIELLRPDGNVLAIAHGLPSWAGDCRLRVELPEDGTYTIRVHDVLYRAEQPGFYRLKVGEFAYADAVIPFAFSASTAVTRRQSRLKLAAGNSTEQSFPFPAVSDIPGAHPLLANLGTKFSGRRPQLLVREEPIIDEQELAKRKTLLAVPYGVNGILSHPGESDMSRFAVQPGEKLRVEVIAERAGLPLDSVLKVSASDGRALANADDFAQTRDSQLDFAVPSGVSEIHVSVTDRMRRGGSDFAYYVFVERVEEPDFSLECEIAELNVPREGHNVFLVRALRNGYRGPISLAFSPPLPSGYRVTGDVIPAGMDQALVTVTKDKANSKSHFTELVGQATLGDRNVRRYATRKRDQVSAYTPWLARRLVVSSAAPRSLNISWEFASSSEPMPGENVSAMVKVSRAADTTGAVRLQLVTNQSTPLFESGPNKNKPQPERAIRLSEAVTLAAEATETVVSITFPRDLPSGKYDIALVAELLSDDGNRVLEQVVTAARRIKVVAPSFDAGYPLWRRARVVSLVRGRAQFRGEIERREWADFTGCVKSVQRITCCARHSRPALSHAAPWAEGAN